MINDYFYNSLYITDVNYFKKIGFPINAFRRLNRGITPIKTEKDLRLYNALYAGHHIAKNKKILSHCSNFIQNGEKFTVVDWACGQALASSMLMDYMALNGNLRSLENIILIEPSNYALKRAKNILDNQLESFGKKINIIMINKFFHELDLSDITIYNQNKYLHLFSNALDTQISSVDHIMKIICTIKKSSLIASTSPNYTNTESAYKNMTNFLSTSSAEIISNMAGYIGSNIYHLKLNQWMYSKISYNQLIVELFDHE